MGLQFRKDLGYKQFTYRGQLVVIDEVKDDEEFKQELAAHDSTLFESADEKPPKKPGRKGGKKPEQPGVQVPMIDHVVTGEDIEKNPELLSEGIKAGDTIQIPAPENE